MRDRSRFARLTFLSLAWNARARFRRAAVERRLKSSRTRPDLKIAVFHQGGIGSGLLLGPMLQRLRDLYPSAVTTLLSWQTADGEFLREARLVTDFKVMSADGSNAGSNGPYDVLLSMARTFDGDKVAGKIRAEVKIGVEHPTGWQRAGCYAHDICVPCRKHAHEVEIAVSLADRMTGTAGSAPSRLIDPGDLHAGGDRTGRAGCLRIAVSPGCSAGMAWKRVSLDTLVRTIERLRKEVGAEVFVIAGPDEKDQAELLIQKTGHNTQLFLATDKLIDTFHFLRSMHCLIANDGMLAHLATVSGTPVTVIAGPTDMASVGPWCPREDFRIVREDLACSPCYRLYSGALNCVNPRTLECLERISADKIVGAVKDLVA